MWSFVRCCDILVATLLSAFMSDLKENFFANMRLSEACRHLLFVSNYGQLDMLCSSWAVRLCFSTTSGYAAETTAVLKRGQISVLFVSQSSVAVFALSRHSEPPCPQCPITVWLPPIIGCAECDSCLCRVRLTVQLSR